MPSKVTAKNEPAKKPAVKKTVDKKAVASEAMKAETKAEVSVAVKAKAKAVASVKADVLGTNGKVLESISLSGKIFGAKVNPVLMSQAVRVYLANQRAGSASTKSRGDVLLTTAKAWRQKGTGRARHGARSAPIFVGGGVAHGPKPKDYSLTISKKMRQLALFSALTAKLADKEVKIVSGLEKLPTKTKEMAAVLKNIDVDTKKQRVLLVVSEGETGKSIIRISRNLDGVRFMPARQLNTYDVLNSKAVIFVKDAVASLEKHYGKESK
jgi:large subunit ribosomal protein L4